MIGRAAGTEICPNGFDMRAGVSLAQGDDDMLGSTIVLKESAGPRHYRFGKNVVYVTRSGKELDEATVRTRVRVGVPVRVHYVGEGDNMVADRVVLDED